MRSALSHLSGVAGTRWRCAAVAVALTVASGSSAGELQPITLQLKWKHQFQFAGYYVAKERGYYREAGLDVSFQEATPGREPIEAVLSGAAEYGVGTSDLLLYRARGSPVVVLGVVFQHSPLALVTLAGSGIDNVHELAGRRVMIEPHSAELLAYLQREGLPLTRVTQVVHSFDIADLLSGATDAMSVYSTDEPFALAAAGRAYSSFTPQEAGIDFYGDNLFTTERELSAHPARARAFRDASFRGWKEAMEHPAEAISLILSKYGQRKSREQLEFEAAQMKPLVQADLVEPGYMHPGRWQHMAHIYSELGMLQGEAALEGFLYAYRPGPPGWVGWTLALLGALSLLGGGAAALVMRANRALAREISQRAASEHRFRALFESSPEPTWILVEGRIVECSRSAAVALGKADRSALDGKTLAHVSPTRGSDGTPTAERWAGHVARALSEGFCRFEWVLERADQTLLPVDMTLVPLRWRERDALYCSFRDTRVHKEAAAALSHARGEAEAASRLKSLFLANMSHELRTPLHAITSLAWLGQREHDPAQLRDYFAQVHQSSETLVSIVNDVLDFSRIEAGRLKVEQVPFSLHEVIDEVRALLQGLAAPRQLSLGVELAPGLPDRVVGDPLRLKQVLTNLGGNAVKFTPAGTVDLRVKPLATPDGRPGVAFEVSDTGIGMAPEQLAGLFQPFTQGDGSRTRRYGGTGLGLAISHQLVGLMGGRIDVRSAEGRGSTFTVQLTFGTASRVVSSPLPEVSAPPRPELQGMRVLVVEDNEVNQVLARRLLEHAGVTVSVAVNGRDAVERVLAGAEGFDAVLMDLQMPELDGYEATSAIRARRGVDELPIFAMSAHALTEDHERSRKAGMNGHIAKPIDVALLYETLAQVRRKREAAAGPAPG